MGTALEDDELDLLCRRYARMGDFNYLAFLKDLEAYAPNPRTPNPKP